MFLQNQFNFEPKKIKAQKLITSHELTNLTTSNAVLCEPDFAVICGFLQKFAFTLNLKSASFQNLLEWLPNQEKLSMDFQNFIIQLFIKAGRPMVKRKFLEDLSAYCATYSMEDAEDVKNIGLHALSVQQKLRLIKELLESLLITNADLVNYVERQLPSELRSQQLGRDRHCQHYFLRQNAVGAWGIYKSQGGLCYFYTKPIASKRKQVLELIRTLNGNGMSDSGIGNEENNNESSSTLLTPDEQQLVIFLTTLVETVFVA